MTELIDRRESPPSKDYDAANRAQKLAADPAHSAFVSANAGSGKTKVLIDRVARLLLQKAPPDSILCITYTKAAAAEMLSRLFERLGDWSVMSSDTLAIELAKLENRQPTDYQPLDITDARALFAKALETPGGLRIETIHAFCARILRRFPIEAQVPPGFREMEDEEANEIWDDAVEAAIIRAASDAPDALDMLATIGGGNGALTAFASLRNHARRLLDFSAEHDGDMAAMAESVRQAAGAPDDSPDTMVAKVMGEQFPRAMIIRTMNILAKGGKSEAEVAAAMKAALSATTPAEAYAHYRTIFLTNKGERRRANPYNAGSAKAHPYLIDAFQMKDGEGGEVSRILAFEAAFAAAKTAERTVALLRVGLPALHAFAAAKQTHAALDFDDLIHETKALLTERLAADWVLYKLDGGLNHLLLDEAQDTSPEQWQLIRALTQEFYSGQGIEKPQNPRTRFVVGDDKQSIYSFQGADPEHFLSEQQQFILDEPTAQMPVMAMSFRSSPEVLRFVDQVFDAESAGGYAFSSRPPQTADASQHTSRRANQAGRVEVWPIVHSTEQDEADAWAAPLDHTGEASPRAILAGQVAVRIREMIENGESVWQEDGEDPARPWYRRPVQAGDFLILVRGRTGGLFEALIAALKEQGLPVAGADRLVLANHIGVQDCLNLMRFACLPEDDLTLAEILRGPFIGLVDDDRYLFPLAHKRAGSLWQSVQESADPDVQHAAGFLRGLIETAGAPPFEFLSLVLDTPYTDGLTGWDRLGRRLGTPARDPVEALLKRALAHDAHGPASLQVFVAEMDKDDTQIKRELAKPQGQVRVMTIHGAKGLQSPIVILPDTTGATKSPDVKIVSDADGTPLWAPSKEYDTPALSAAREAATLKAEWESKRLLYVALTRAQDHLIICGAEFQKGYAKGSWYEQCLGAMDVLAPARDEAPAIRLYGAPAGVLNAAATGSRDRPAAPEWLGRAAPQRETTTRILSPSALMQDRAPVLPPFDPRRENRLRRGRLIHGLLERLPELKPEARPAAAAAYLAAVGTLTPAMRDEMLGATFGVLDDPAFSDLFTANGRAEAVIIGTSPDLPSGTIINGRVDRLVMTDSQVLVIDFKTDRPAPASPSGVSPTYIAQMAAYRAVLLQAYPGKSVRCALLWTDGPQIMWLLEDMLSDSLKRLNSGV